MKSIFVPQCVVESCPNYPISSKTFRNKSGKNERKEKRIPRVESADAPKHRQQKASLVTPCCFSTTPDRPDLIRTPTSIFFNNYYKPVKKKKKEKTFLYRTRTVFGKTFMFVFIVVRLYYLFCRRQPRQPLQTLASLIISWSCPTNSRFRKKEASCFC